MKKVGNRKYSVHETRSTSMIEIVKPPTDLRAYRVVILPNGITAMLISETHYFIQGDDDGHATERELMESDDMAEDGEAAAALCIGLGSFCDPDEVPGFAHFMEHMVFMGSKKFPKENQWDEFLAKNGGESNAWTDCERTCFFFVNQQSTFLKALDIFAQFFIGPLFNKDSVDREILAVDSECQMMASNDSERMRNIISHVLVEDGHPMKKFMAGNKKSLKDDPERNKINVYEMLHDFYKRIYSAHYMTLVVHSSGLETASSDSHINGSLDDLEQQILKIFSKIPNNGIPHPKFIKPPFQDKNFNKVIKVIPMEDTLRMDLIWALPSLMKYYRVRVVEFLAVLLGHEGKGSILSQLRKKNFALEIAGGNDMTGFTHNSTWTAFVLSIKLTENGVQHVQEILDIIYQYINILKESLPAHVFEEQKHIEETKYIFHEDDSIYSYVEELAENMHLFPPEHYICGRNLYFEYNEQLILQCLQFLRPESMLIMMYNKHYNELPNLSMEPWLGTKYTMTDVDPNWIQRLNKVPVNPDLQVPELNPYIATDFSLVKGRGSTKFPVVVVNEDGCRMWYKKDSKFHSPKAHVFFNLISNAISRSSLNLVLGDIYLTMLLHKLTETLYNATLAGYEYSLEGTPEGIIMITWGYSEKIQLVTRDMLAAFEELELGEDAFKSVVTHLRQIYINELMKPVELARAVRFCLLEETDPSIMERYEQLEHVSLAKLKSYVDEFHSSLFVEAFISGNLTSEDVVEIGKLSSKLVWKTLPADKFPKPIMMKLPEGEFKCLIPAINKEDTNSCVMQYYQQGPGTFFNLCLNEILGAAMAEPLFNVLRTEYQLGYSVYSMPIVSYGVLGFVIVVESQANKFRMEKIDEIMDQFVRNFETNLEEMPKEKFLDLLNMQAVTRTADDGDLFDESSRFWSEISRQSYVFDRQQKEMRAIEKMQQKDLLAWYQHTMLHHERKLSLMLTHLVAMEKTSILDVAPRSLMFSLISLHLADHYFKTVQGHLTSEEFKPSPPISTLNTVMKSLRTYVPNIAKYQPEMRHEAHHLPGHVERGRQSQGDVTLHQSSLVKPIKDEESGYITDLRKFKNTLKPMPYHIINK